MPQVVSFINMKGGVGKTTLAVNVAYGLAYYHKKKFLIIDADPQFNATQYLLEDKRYLKHLKDEKATLSDVFVRRPGLSTPSQAKEVRTIRGKFRWLKQRRHFMKRIALLLFAVAMVSGVVAARAQTSTPTNEPPAKLIVDSPVPDLLAQGIVWIPWRVENLHIGPVFGKDALNASPRVGHLHIHVDDLPWLWADMSNNPIDVALLPPGPHKIRIELVNAIHQSVLGQSKTVTFTIPERAAPSQ